MLSLADLADFEADYIVLLSPLSPETTLDSKINPINIKMRRAIANLSRMNAILMHEEIDYNELEKLYLAILDNLKNMDNLRNDFFKTLNL